MSATNATATISLPLFIGTDKPAWLTDWNGAMNTIDSSIATLQTAEAGTATSLASLAQSVEALSGTVGQHTTALTTLSTAVSGNTGSINTINSLIGNGQPTTEDKTIIGAINEIYAEIGSGAGVAAADVTYDNTTSGLTADDVQEALDEINAKIPASSTVEADDVVFDNTTSGLSATNVQDAIDEIASTGGVGDWQTVADITAIPATYKELCVIAKNNNGNGTCAYIPKAAVESGASVLKFGGYIGGSDNMGLAVSFTSSTAISIIDLFINGTQETNLTRTVLYR